MADDDAPKRDRRDFAQRQDAAMEPTIARSERREISATRVALRVALFACGLAYIEREYGRGFTTERELHRIDPFKR
jgi:hypothetical protein